MIIGQGSTTETLNADRVQELLAHGLEPLPMDGQRVLVIIPDSTRTAPIPLLFRLLYEQVGRRVARLDYLIALGTHPPMSEEAIERLVGVTTVERVEQYPNSTIFNHRWDLPEALQTVGMISRDESAVLTDGLLATEVPVVLNRLIFDYDQLVICGPVFPHEVVGFSGGAKYLFPGFDLFDYDVYALCGDGDMMEGVASEAASLAGHLKLANLCMQHRQLPDDWDMGLQSFPADLKGLAGRDTSSRVLNTIAQHVPWLLGGAADLTPSTKTRLTFVGAGDFTAAASGRNLHFGVREHAMGAILNGLSLCKIRPYGAGFLIFSDYARPAIRLSALMELPMIHIFTHYSIGVGEDGPTHQPIEQLASLRAIPSLIVLRPADANEVVEAWRVIMQLRHQPVALILTRQALPTLDRTVYGPASGVAQGAYILADAPDGTPDVLLLASGSEVALCVQAYEQLQAEGIKARVVSVPSWELFEQQTKDYRDSIIPPDITARVSVEQASTFGWARFTGLTGARLGMRTFGASAPLQELQHKVGFTTEKIITTARSLVQSRLRLYAFCSVFSYFFRYY
jgi:transketolase C-terminal domain/subunit